MRPAGLAVGVISAITPFVRSILISISMEEFIEKRDSKSRVTKLSVSQNGVFNEPENHDG